MIRDANGNELNDGDTVTVIKDLKVKGSSLVVKVGTKVKNIRLVDGDHDIDCKIDGVGAMKLKSEFVKRSNKPNKESVMQRFLASLLLVCSSLLAATSASAKTDQQTIVLISIDGFRYNYIEQHHAEHLNHLAEQGVRAEGLMPVYPSKTFPNHLSIVTGQYPSHHGIVDNTLRYGTQRTLQNG